MGRKTKSRRNLMSKRKRMTKLRGKFREAKKKVNLQKKPTKPKRFSKPTKPKVDRSKKIGWLKKLREQATEWKNE